MTYAEAMYNVHIRSTMCPLYAYIVGKFSTQHYYNAVHLEVESNFDTLCIHETGVILTTQSIPVE